MVKLNHDCVRDLLLAVEDASFAKILLLPELLRNQNLKLYPEEDIVYTAQQLLNGEYIQGDLQFYDRGATYNLCIFSMTWKGHELLDNIRDKSVWEEATNKVSKIASVSLPILCEISAAIINARLS